MNKLFLTVAGCFILVFMLAGGCASEPAKPDGPGQTADGMPDEISQWVEYSLPLFLGQVRLLDGKAYVLVTYGEKMTGGYTVEIIDLKQENDRILVIAEFRDPGADEMVTQALTYPYDLKVIDDPGLPVEFIAQGAQEYIPVLYGIDYLPSVGVGTQWIRIFRPSPGEAVPSRFNVEGIANVFEGTVLYRLLDGDGHLVDEGFTTGMMGDWGYFSVEVEPGELESGSPLSLELFTESAKDGTEENLIQIELTVQ